MSKYTTEVRFICETYAGKKESGGYGSIPEVIEKARPKVFDFDFPIFDPLYKPVLETKILKHYYTREISEETVSLWKLRLDSKLNEIMPYYNRLYETELIKFNPLYMTDLYTDRNVQRDNNFSSTTDTSNETNRTGSDTTTDTVNNVFDNWELFQDTPQGSLSGVEDENYLTTARHSKGDTEGSESVSETEYNSGSNSSVSAETNSAGNDTETYSEHVYGYAGHNPSESILKFRETLINIDVMILDELKPLFFNLW